jgi:hypothetical protein
MSYTEVPNQSFSFDLSKFREDMRKEIREDMKENNKDDGVYFKYAIWSITCMAATASCTAALVLIVMEISKNMNTTTST